MDDMNLDDVNNAIDSIAEVEKAEDTVVWRAVGEVSKRFSGYETPEDQAKLEQTYENMKAKIETWNEAVVDKYVEKMSDKIKTSKSHHGEHMMDANELWLVDSDEMRIEIAWGFCHGCGCLRYKQVNGYVHGINQIYQYVIFENGQRASR